MFLEERSIPDDWRLANMTAIFLLNFLCFVFLIHPIINQLLLQGKDQYWSVNNDWTYYYTETERLQMMIIICMIQLASWHHPAICQIVWYLKIPWYMHLLIWHGMTQIYDILWKSFLPRCCGREQCLCVHVSTASQPGWTCDWSHRSSLWTMCWWTYWEGPAWSISYTVSPAVRSLGCKVSTSEHIFRNRGQQGTVGLW